MTGVVIAVATLVAAAVAGLLWRRSQGRMRVVTVATHSGDSDGADQAAGAQADQALLATLGVSASAPVTLLQFSSAFCAPCRATRRILADVAGMFDGVHHVEVDAESHLDAVRALDIRRTPTVLVVDDAGRVVKRASGQPTRSHVVAAVAPLLVTDPSR